MRIEKNAIENKGKVLIARGDDDNEQNFIDAVNSIRQKGYAVSDIISRLGEHAYCLHKGHSVHSVKNDVFKCSVSIKNATINRQNEIKHFSLEFSIQKTVYLHLPAKNYKFAKEKFLKLKLSFKSLIDYAYLVPTTKKVSHQQSARKFDL